MRNLTCLSLNFFMCWNTETPSFFHFFNVLLLYGKRCKLCSAVEMLCGSVKWFPADCHPENASCHHLSFSHFPLQTLFLLPLLFPCLSPSGHFSAYPFSASVSGLTTIETSTALLNPNFHQHISSCEPLVCTSCMPLSSTPSPLAVVQLHEPRSPPHPCPFLSLAVLLSVFTPFSSV